MNRFSWCAVLILMGVNLGWACGQEKISYEQAKVTLINNVRISAKDAGVVTAVKIQHGAQVRLDQILVNLDESLYDAEYQAAK